MIAQAFRMPFMHGEQVQRTTLGTEIRALASATFVWPGLRSGTNSRLPRVRPGKLL